MPVVTFPFQTLILGAERPHFSSPRQEKFFRDFKFTKQEPIPEDEAMMKGLLGHPVYMPIKFENYSWTDQIGKASFVTRVIEGLFLPICVVQVSRGKLMEMTPVEGRDGTVKEYASHDDYQVNISSVLIGTIDEDGVPAETGLYPIEEKQKLLDVEAAKVAVPVAGKLFEHLGIEWLVVKKVTWIPMEGVQTAQAFEMECYSDMPIELKLSGEV